MRGGSVLTQACCTPAQSCSLGTSPNALGWLLSPQVRLAHLDVTVTLVRLGAWAQFLGLGAPSLVLQESHRWGGRSSGQALAEGHTVHQERDPERLLARGQSGATAECTPAMRTGPHTVGSHQKLREEVTGTRETARANLLPHGKWSGRFSTQAGPGPRGHTQQDHRGSSQGALELPQPRPAVGSRAADPCTRPTAQSPPSGFRMPHQVHVLAVGPGCSRGP